MTPLSSLRFETVSFYNRIARQIDVDLCCLQVKHKGCVVLLRRPAGGGGAQLDKNAEHLAFQLRQKLEIAGEQLTFLLCCEDDNDSCLRWRFDWAGSTPVQLASESIPARALEKFFTEGNSHPIRFTGPSAVSAVA